MSNKFDSYREALVVENHTIWSDEFDDWSREDRSRMEAILHANPEQVAFLDLVPDIDRQLLDAPVDLGPY